MPSVLDQALPFADSISGRGRSTPPLFCRFFNGPCGNHPNTWGETGRRISRSVAFRGGVPDFRTVRAKRPMPSASDPSTGSELLWTGLPRPVAHPGAPDPLAVEDVE